MDGYVVKILCITMLAPLLGFFSPTIWSMLSLVIAWGFNIFAGMRVDGVSIVRCNNFSISKFKNSILEFLLYLVILQVMYSIVRLNSTMETAITLVKAVTWVYVYVYISNSLKNLRKAYPKNKVILILYYFVRFEFLNILPSNINKIIKKVEAYEQQHKD